MKKSNFKGTVQVLGALAIVGGVIVLSVRDFLGFSIRKDHRILESVDKIEDDTIKSKCLMAIIKKETKINASVDDHNGANINCSC